MNKRSLISVFLVLIIMFAVNTPANASTKEITPLWQHIQSMISILDIDNGFARMTGRVSGNISTESITVTATLVQVSGGVTNHIATWNNLTTNGRIWTWEHTRSVATGFDYQLILTATVVRNGVRESGTERSLVVRAW